MTDKPTPTDAEILDAAEDFRSQYTHGGTTFDEFDEIGFTRAVLAKWGTPAGAEEPFCWHWENTFNGGTGTVKKNPETLGINIVHPDHKWTALYTAPQPVAREQLTRERVKEIVRGAGYDQCGIPDTERAAFINGLRHGEQAHGIKGGQHGTE